MQSPMYVAQSRYIYLFCSFLFQKLGFCIVDQIRCFLPGTQIYCLNGTDPEGQEVRYGLSFDPGSKEYLRVDPVSGNITLVEKLDREVK